MKLLMTAAAAVLTIPALTACGNADADAYPQATFEATVGKVQPIDFDCGDYFEAGMSPDYSPTSEGYATPQDAVLAVIEINSGTLPYPENAALDVTTEEVPEQAYHAQVVVRDSRGEPLADFETSAAGSKGGWLVQDIEFCTNQLMPKEARDS